MSDDRVLPDGHDKEEGFWHVVPKKDQDSGESSPNYRCGEGAGGIRETGSPTVKKYGKN
jgi:hypothetical protein